MIITLNDIRSHNPCKAGWYKLLRGLDKSRSDSEPLEIQTVLDILGLEDTVWCLRAVPIEDCRPRLFSIYLANTCRDMWPVPELPAAVEASFAYCERTLSLHQLIDAARSAWRAVGDMSMQRTQSTHIEAARAACWATMYINDECPESWTNTACVLWAANAAKGPSVECHSKELLRLCNIY